MKVSVSKLISRSSDELFELSQNYSRRLEWDSYLCEAYLMDNATVANVGVDSYCKSKSGVVIISRYISYNPPRVSAVKMIKGPWVLESFSGSWNFKEKSPNSSLVSFTYSFKARPKAARWFLEPIIAHIYKRDMKTRLLAFKNWAEGI